MSMIIPSGALYFNLGVYMGSQVAPQTQGLIDVLADRRARVGEFLIDVLDAIDFEADRVQAGLFFDGLVVLGFQHGEIDMSSVR
jgi:hypothetical protein